MTDRLRVGVIGTGFGKQHIRTFNVHPRSVVTAVCSTDAARAADIARQFDVPHAFGDYRAMLDDAPIDAVAVITSPDWHAPISTAALDAGKHVMCAKPLAATLTDARVLRDRARASGLVHCIDHNLRFAWHSRLLKEHVEAGTLGRPLSITNLFGLHLPTYYANAQASPNKNAWFARRDRSGGLFLANAPHEFDRLMWLFGPVVGVSGQAHVALREVTLPDGRAYQTDADDSYHAVIEFASGAMALTQCTPISYQLMSSRVEIHGTDGSLLEEGRGPNTTVKLASTASQGYVDLPVPEHLARPNVPDGASESIYGICDAFVRAILDGEPMSPTFDDGYWTQELIEAVLRSGQSGDRQVLPLT